MSTQPKIQPGSIVSVVCPEVRKRVGNFKLLPKFKNQFIVIKRTSSSAFIRPCNEIHMKDFLMPKKRYEEQESEPLYKIDLEQLKYITSVTILSSNKANKFYSEFLQKHKLPENQYFFESKMGAEICNFEDLVKQNQYNEFLLDELDGIQINIVKEGSCSTQKSALRNFSKQVLEIANVFKQLQNDNKECGIKKIIKKTVTFESFVVEYPLIKPRFIYYARKRRVVPISFEQKDVIRNFYNMQGSHFCTCNFCKIQNTTCGSDWCSQCF